MAINIWKNENPSFDYVNSSALNVNLSRQKSAPLDVSSEFSSVADMLYYVTEGRYPVGGVGVSDKVKDMTKYPYLGQIIALVSTDPEEVQIYYIKTAEYDASLTTSDDIFNHYFAEVGKATIGDDKSINLDVDTGVLSLTGFGTEYYAYNITTNAYDATPTTGWKAGLIPQVIADGSDTKIAWFEPNPTTVEGLETSINAINTAIGTKPSSGVPEGNTLYGMLSDLESSKAEADTTYSKTETDSAISAAIAAMGSVFNFVGSKTTAEFGSLNAADYDVGDVFLVEGQEYVVVPDGDGKKFEAFGDPDGISSIIDQIGADTTAGTIKGRIKTLETDVSNINTAIGTDTTAGTIKGRIKTLEDKAADIEDGAQVNVIEGVAVSGKVTGTVTIGADKTATINVTNVSEAAKVTNALTIGGKTYDGSAATSITLDDLGVVSSTTIASESKLGLVKAGTGTGAVAVDPTTGVMSVSKVSSAVSADTANATVGTLTVNFDPYLNKPTYTNKTFDGSTDVTLSIPQFDIATPTMLGLVKSAPIIDPGVGEVVVDTNGLMTVAKVASATTADKTTGKLTVGNATAKTFDGSANVTLSLTDIGAATTAQGAKADSAIQGIKIGTTALTPDTSKIITIAKADIETLINLSTYATSTDLDAVEAKADTNAASITALNGDYVSKSKANTITSATTFSGKVTVPAPTADTDAATKKYVDDEISTNLSAVDSMTFKGLITPPFTMPTANVKNGDTYKVTTNGVVTTGESSTVTAKQGDMFIALVTTTESTATIEWQYIPSGDENNGNVMAGATLTDNQLIIGSGSQDVKTLAAGTNGQVLKMAGGVPTWSAETKSIVSGSTDTDGTKVEVTSSVSGSETTYTASVSAVNVNKLVQTEGEYIIFDCGSATI